jgi:hypothetical protein
MKLIELTTDLRPWRRGDNVPVPDALADILVASGEATNPRPYLPREPSIADLVITQPPIQTDCPADGKPTRRKYLTK